MTITIANSLIFSIIPPPPNSDGLDCPVILPVQELAVFGISPVKSFFHELTSRFAMIADWLGLAETVKNKNRRCYERYAPSGYPRMFTQAYWEKMYFQLKLKIHTFNTDLFFHKSMC